MIRECMIISNGKIAIWAQPGALIAKDYATGQVLSSWVPDHKPDFFVLPVNGVYKLAIEFLNRLMSVDAPIGEPSQPSIAQIASELGRRGGCKTSERKARASARNAKLGAEKGGRPRKVLPKPDNKID